MASTPTPSARRCTSFTPSTPTPSLRRFTRTGAYGECAHLDDRMGSPWWARHAQSFAARQRDAYERSGSLGWAFDTWKFDEDTESSMHPAVLAQRSLRAASQAGWLPDLSAKPALPPCLKAPAADFALGDATAPPCRRRGRSPRPVPSDTAAAPASPRGPAASPPATPPAATAARGPPGACSAPSPRRISRPRTPSPTSLVSHTRPAAARRTMQSGAPTRGSPSDRPNGRTRRRRRLRARERPRNSCRADGVRPRVDGVEGARVEMRASARLARTCSRF